MLRLCLLLPLALSLSACMSPCQRISRDMDRLNADLIRNPGIATTGAYLSRLQELGAEAVENRCF